MRVQRVRARTERAWVLVKRVKSMVLPASCCGGELRMWFRFGRLSSSEGVLGSSGHISLRLWEEP